MPYVSEKSRQALHPVVKALQWVHLDEPGYMEYIIARMIREYVKRHELRHKTIAEIRGVLIGALAEFDRRVAFPYEDQKIVENGDVYDTSE